MRLDLSNDCLTEILRSRSIKVTPQRIEIFRKLASTKSHPAADTVYNDVRRVFPSISFNTVYTTLLLFADLGLIHIAESFGEAKRFDADTHDHGHFRCISCGAIEDFEYEKDISSFIPASFSKKAVRKRLILEGYCKKCGKNS